MEFRMKRRTSNRLRPPVWLTLLAAALSGGVRAVVSWLLPTEP